MDADGGAIPDDIAALKEALAIERAKALEVAADLAVARAKASEDSALIAQQKLRIAKLERQIYGQRSERSSRLIDQLALTFEELEADATEDELAAERAAARTTTVRGFTRKRAERQTFPEHLPRERVVIDPPTACACCGSNRLRKLGEDVTRTLESVPRQWKVIETVREKYSCRDCEKISQAPAPCPHRCPSGSSAGRIAALELDPVNVSNLSPSGMTMHVNKVHRVTTINRVAQDLGEDEDWLSDVASEMDAEDGRLWVYGVGEDGVMAFTDFGIETLMELIRIHKVNPHLLRRQD